MNNLQRWSARNFLPRTTLLAAALAVASASASAASLNLPDFTPLVDDVTPAIASIRTEVKINGRVRGGGTGSGFVLSSDGYILTNHHVVAEADSIRVKLKDGRELPAKKIGEDEATDVALLKIDAKDLKAAKIGDPEKLKPGAWVLAFGAPLGLDFSVSAGIVSAKGRSLPGSQYVPFIQSDTSINRGNSGGPLVNASGEVVGINSQIMSNTGGSIGLSFSIPIDVALDVVQQIKANGRVSRGYVGVSIQPLDADMAETFGLDRPRGALIGELVKEGPAEKGGLKVGDVITAIDGQTVESSEEAPPIIGRIRPGKTVPFDVLRNGKPTRVMVKIGEAPNSGTANTGGGEEATPRKLGMTLRVPTDAELKEADVESGLLITNIEGGPAADAGLSPGDVIVSVGQKAVRTVDEFREALKGFKPGRSAPLLVSRRGTTRFLPLRIPD